MTPTYYERLELSAVPGNILLDGYERKQPSGWHSAPLVICADCGVICKFRPFSKPDSYRAFVVCPQCGRATEF